MQGNRDRTSMSTEHSRRNRTFSCDLKPEIISRFGPVISTRPEPRNGSVLPLEAETHREPCICRSPNRVSYRSQDLSVSLAVLVLL